MTKQTIVVFDFDETLITKDTLIDFARFNSNPISFIVNMGLLSPFILLFIIRGHGNQAVKERLLHRFYGGWGLDRFNKRCQAYVERLNKLSNPEAIKALQDHKKLGHSIVIISASIENWIKPWAEQFGVETIATKLDIKDQRVTGKIQGKNCHGQEKVNRFVEAYPNRDDYEIVVYGDGKSDKEIFKFADRYYEKTFTV